MPGSQVVGSHVWTGPDSGGRSHRWSPGTTHLAQDYENIFQQGFSTIASFLVATSDPDIPIELQDGETPRVGAKSLVDSCLDKLSQNLVERQRESDTNNDGFDGQCDIIGSELRELEDYFGDTQAGWPPLRRVTRHCGIYRITRLVRTGALLDHAATELAMRWYNCALLRDFAEAMSEALFDTSPHLDNPDVDFQHRLNLGDSNRAPMDEFWRSPTKVRLVLRRLQTGDDVLPFLARFVRFRQLHATLSILHTTKDVDVQRGLSEVLEAIFMGSLSTASTSAQHDALRGESTTGPIETVEPAPAQPVSREFWDRLERGLDLIFILCHIFAPARFTALLEKMSKRVQILIELGGNLRWSERQQFLATRILFANLCQLLSNGRAVSKDLLLSLDGLALREPSLTVSMHLTNLIMSLARMQPTYQRLMEQLIALDCGGCWALNRVLATSCGDAAIAYSLEHPAAEINFWAMDIDDKAWAKMGNNAGRPDVLSTPKPRQGYRWEDFIQEWVARSPQMCLKSNGEMNTLTSQTEYDSRVEDGRGQHRRVMGKCRPPLAPLSSNTRTGAGGLKRKSVSQELEVYRDGDFEYKKPRREVRCCEASSGQDNSRVHIEQGPEDESEDELSLLTEVSLVAIGKSMACDRSW